MFLGIGMGRSAVAVIRVSGPKATEVAVKMGRIKKDLLVPRKACLRNLVDPENGEVLDSALLLWFPQPHSFTGEDSVGSSMKGINLTILMLASLNFV